MYLSVLDEMSIFELCNLPDAHAALAAYADKDLFARSLSIARSHWCVSDVRHESFWEGDVCERTGWPDPAATFDEFYMSQLWAMVSSLIGTFDHAMALHT